MYNCGVSRMNSRTILVVEDDPNDESLTLRAFRGMGISCSVVVARSGRDALDYLLRQGVFEGRGSADPCLIFMDNTLPGVPGNELVRTIRAIEDLQGLPLVVFSGSSDGVLIDRCRAAGADDFIEKPLDMDDYISTLQNAAKRWLN